MPKITVIVGGSLARGTMRCAGRLTIRGLFCVADGSLCGDERCFGGEYAGGDSGEADGARRQKLSEEEKQALLGR